MFRRLCHLLEMIRFSHTLFALPFALLAAAMAWSENARSNPPVPWRWQDLAGILACMVFARSTAMAFNRLADRRLDAVNPRTDGRHLPAGILSTQAVVVFLVVCSLGFVGGTLLFLPRNPIPLYCSAPVLLFVMGYSYAKRFTLAAHVWLGAGLMLAPWGAWVAIRAEVFAWPPIILGGAVLLWVAGFDIIYACQDVEFDRKMRLRSVPARFGIRAALWMAAVCHLGMVALLLVLPLVYSEFKTTYILGVVAIGLLLIYEHSLVRSDDLSRVNRAFFCVNAVVSIGLLVIGSLDLLL